MGIRAVPLINECMDVWGQTSSESLAVQPDAAKHSRDMSLQPLTRGPTPVVAGTTHPLSQPLGVVSWSARSTVGSYILCVSSSAFKAEGNFSPLPPDPPLEHTCLVRPHPLSQTVGSILFFRLLHRWVVRKMPLQFGLGSRGTQKTTAAKRRNSIRLAVGDAVYSHRIKQENRQANKHHKKLNSNRGNSTWIKQICFRQKHINRTNNLSSAVWIFSLVRVCSAP